MKNYYEVWALGFDKDDFCTDVEEFLGEFDTKDAAVEYAKTLDSLTKFYGQDTIDNYLEDGDYLEIVVEEIANHEDIYEAVDTIHVAYLKRN